MKTKKNRLFAGILVLALIASTTAFSFANENEKPYDGEEMLLENVLLENDDPFLPTRSVQMMCSLAFNRTTSTTAEAIVRVLADEVGDTFTSTITLQKLSSSGSYVNTSAAPAVQILKNEDILNHKATFKIGSSNNYRIKVVIKLKKNGTTTSKSSPKLCVN